MKNRILLIAYDINPLLGSECGVGHSYLKIYAKHYNVDVYTGSRHKVDIDKFNYGENVTFYYIDYSLFDKKFKKYGIYFISNWFFCKEVYKRLLNSNIAEYKFMHIITPMAIYAFNKLYKLKIKYLFGPVNGGLKSPKNFKEVFKNEVIFDFLRNFIYKGLTKLPVWNKYYKNASAIINSDHNVLKIVPKKFHHKTFQIFDTLANTDIFMPNPQKLDTPKTIVLLFCGRLIAKKGVLLLLEAYKRCLETHKIDNLLLNIAGNGQLYQQIIDFIKTNNLEGKVNVYSKLSRESVVEKYKEAHIFCAPTLREPGGTAILEAMACSLPIITSNYGGPSFSVTDECGIKINMVDYQTYTNDLTDAILYLYNNPEVRNEMGSKGRERAIKEFSLQSVEQKLTKIWKTL